MNYHPGRTTAVGLEYITPWPNCFSACKKCLKEQSYRRWGPHRHLLAVEDFWSCTWRSDIHGAERWTWRSEPVAMNKCKVRERLICHQEVDIFKLKDFASYMATINTVFCSLDEFVSTQFDFLIVGDGTAGLALSVRLSENDRFKVGVLEAGGNKLEDPLVNVPTLYVQELNVPDYDWTLKSIPQVLVRAEECDAC